MSSNGGMPNTFVKLLKHDRGRLKNLCAQLSELSRRLGSLKIRAVQSFFLYTSLQRERQIDGLDSIPPFSILCHLYSNFTYRVTVEINLKNGTFEARYEGSNTGVPEGTDAVSGANDILDEDLRSTEYHTLEEASEGSDLQIS